jgi:hypothetical protein
LSTNGRKPFRHGLPGAQAPVLWRRWLARALPFYNIRYWPDREDPAKPGS